MNLRTLLDDHQCKRGFENFPYLAKRLKKAFSEMKAGLETEVVHLKDSYSDIEKKLHSLECTIADNIPKMLFSSQRKKVQGAAIMSYISMVEGIASKEKPTLMRLTLEMMRKEEAVKVYERLIDIIEPYYKEERKDGNSINASGSFLNVQCYFDSLRHLVDTQFHSFKPSESDDKWVVSVDAIFKEYFDTHPNEAFELAQSDQSSLDNYFQDLLSNRSDMNDGLLAEIRERFKQIPEHAWINRIAREEISLDELLIECFGKADTIEDYRDHNRYPHLRIFTQINSLLDVMWQYEPFNTPGSQQTAKQIIVGVHDQRAHLFDHHNGYDSFLDKTASYWFVQFGDPDRIVFLIQEIAIPAFKLSDAKNWADDYNARKDTFYAFTDTRLEDIDMIMPNNYKSGDIEKE